MYNLQTIVNQSPCIIKKNVTAKLEYIKTHGVMFKFIEKIFDWLYIIIDFPKKVYEWFKVRTVWIVRVFFIVLLFVFYIPVYTFLSEYSKWIEIPFLVIGFSFIIFFTSALLEDTTNIIKQFLAPYFENKFKMSKYYIHPKILLFITIGVLLIFISLYIEDIVVKILCAVLGGLILAGGLSGAYRFLFDEQINLSKLPTPSIEIHDSHILYVKHYWFWRATVNKNPVVKADQINEVILNSLPISIVINGNEVVFLNFANTKEEIQAFAERNNIPISERIEVWSLILEPFLDTEQTEEDKERDFQILEREGFSENEVKSIRRRVAFSMYSATYASLEWIYYGHWDVLLYHVPIFSWRSFYWETMKIALRNFKSSKKANK